MKKIIALSVPIIIGMIGFISRGYCQNGTSSQAGSEFNFTRFTQDRVNITKELETLTSSEYKTHPEYGVLPFNAPCQDCIELLQKRDETHRYFAKTGSNGKEFYAQTSYGNLSYRDENGVLRTIDSRMRPTGQQGIFKALNQPFPVTINIPEKYTSILNAGKELQVNRDVNIYVEHKDGSIASLGEPNWSDYTAGDDGIVVHNFYPGIDLEMRVGGGNVESFYRLNKPLQLGDGWLVIRDNMRIPQGIIYDYTHTEKMENNFYAGTLFLGDQSGTHYFYIGAPSAHDENGEHHNAINLTYQINDNGVYDLYIPIAWMNDSKRSYPLVIDPFVTATSSLPAASITGSGYNMTCFAAGTGCTYDLNVAVPPACVIVDITTTFWFRALGTCNLEQGAWDISYTNVGLGSTCRFPAVGKFNTCAIGLPGLCQLTDLSCFIDIEACLPAPSCNPPPMAFVLDFYRCVSPGAGCGFSCITSDVMTPTPWSMTVTGRTVEVTTQDESVCLGSSVNLTANATWGVPPYTYTWTPGNLNGNPVTITPAASGPYTVTVSTCGGEATASAISNVTVFPNDNPGFTIAPNPACTGQQVTITGNAGAGAVDTNYSWLVPGATPAAENEMQTFNVTYGSAGNDNITLNWTSPTSGCLFPSTLPITINAGAAPSVSISVPTNPICAGASVTFTSSTPNTGTFQWQVNGIPQAGETNPTFTTAGLHDGDQVTVILTANGIICGSNIVTSNTITMVVNPIVTPAVTITTVPTGTICPGTSVTFTADTTNGGSNPTYQWQAGGNANAGNGISYTSNTLQNGDVVTVTMTSNAPCPDPPTATAQVTMQVYPAITVTTMGDTTICPGQPVTICAIAAAGSGAPYIYSWNNGAGSSNCPVVAPTTVGATVYAVTASDTCHSAATDSVTVTVAPPPNPNFSFSPTDASILTPTIYFTDESTNGSVVSWNFGDSACGNNISTLPDPSHTYCAPGTYTVELIEQNPSGCFDSIFYTVEINDEYYFYIPNSFTPNGDGINDYFAPQGTDALQVTPLLYDMAIYDRWGEKIFETTDSSVPWNGTASGGSKVAQPGVYVYRIKFQNPDFSDKVLVGSVTLVR